MVSPQCSANQESPAFRHGECQDVINVDRVKDITYDYTGVMGVPITYLGVHNPSEYEILGTMNWSTWRGYECYAIVNGKHKYQRLIIKKRPAT